MKSLFVNSQQDLYEERCSGLNAFPVNIVLTSRQYSFSPPAQVNADWINLSVRHFHKYYVKSFILAESHKPNILQL